MVDHPPSRDPGQLALPIGRRRGPATWDGLVEAWLAVQRSPNTARAYRRACSAWGAWCAAQSLDPLDAARADVTAWLTGLAATRSASTVKQAISGIGGAYRLGHVDGLVDVDPTAHVIRPPSPETTSLGLELDDLVKLLAAADDHSPLASALYRIYGYTGLRATEPIGCDVTQLVYRRGHLVLSGVRTKGAKTRDVPLARQAADALTLYLDERSTGPLFIRPLRRRTLDWTVPDPERRRLTYSHVTRLTKQLLAAAGLPAIALHTHDLRHSFVTHAGDLPGVDLEDVQDAVGHADPRTTRHYDRLKGQIDRHPGQALADHLATQRRPSLFDQP